MPTDKPEAVNQQEPKPIATNQEEPKPEVPEEDFTAKPFPELKKIIQINGKKRMITADSWEKLHEECKLRGDIGDQDLDIKIVIDGNALGVEDEARYKTLIYMLPAGSSYTLEVTGVPKKPAPVIPKDPVQQQVPQQNRVVQKHTGPATFLVEFEGKQD